MRKLLLSAMLLCVLTGNAFANFITYDADADFNLAALKSGNPNPNGVWRYGYGSAKINTTFTAFTASNWIPSSDPYLYGFRVASNYTPGIFRAKTNVFGLIQDQFAMHSGEDPNGFSVLRFVAPTSGLYQMELKWFQGDSGAVSVDVNTSTTNGLVSIANTNSYGEFGVAPIQQVNLTQGEFIELRIGRAGGLSNDSTPVSFKVTAVPEPSSLACVSGLVAGLSVLSRRRRQA
jgi:hypothetical protein